MVFIKIMHVDTLEIFQIFIEQNYCRYSLQIPSYIKIIAVRIAIKCGFEHTCPIENPEMLFYDLLQ